MNPVVGIVGLIVVIALLLGAGAVMLQRLRRGAATAGRALGAELEADPPLHDPEAVEYAGGHGSTTLGRVPFGRVNGILVLTGTRLLFREVNGAGVELVLDQIESVRVAREYDGLRPPRPRPQDKKKHAEPAPEPVFLVVSAADCVVGFVVGDPDAWRRAVASAAPLA